MELALQYQLPIVIHSRNAMQTTINMVKPFAQRGLTGIFHCFSGSKESAKQIIDMGFYLGIGGVVTYPKAGLAEVLASIDLQYIVLETDAPYLSPVPYRGKRNEPSYIFAIAEKIATIYSCSLAEIVEITSQNAQKVFVTTRNS
jgi:TatD DNase family protein